MSTWLKNVRRNSKLFKHCQLCAINLQNQMSASTIKQSSKQTNKKVNKQTNKSVTKTNKKSKLAKAPRAPPAVCDRSWLSPPSAADAPTQPIFLITCDHDNDHDFYDHHCHHSSWILWSPSSPLSPFITFDHDYYISPLSPPITFTIAIIIFTIDLST